MVESLPPADWFPDPTGRHEQRWWDGESWTEHVFSAGTQAVDPLEAATGPEPTGTDGATDGDVDEAPSQPHAAEATTRAPSDGEPEGAGPQTTAPEDAERQVTEPDVAAGPESADPQGDVQPRPEPAAPSAHDELRALADDLADPSGTPTTSQAPDGWFLLDAPVRVTPGERPPPSVPAPEQTPAQAPADPAGGTAADAPDEATTTEPASAARPIPGGFVAGRPAPIDPAPVTDPAPPLPGSEPEPVEGDEAAAAAASTTPTPAPAPGRVVGPLVDAARDPGDGDPVALENRRLLRVRLDGGSVLARQGTMVAHRGQLDVRHEGAGGIGRVLRRAATGEGVRMMRVTGSGEVFLADGARHVFLLHLEGDAALSVSGRSVLAFQEGLQWQVERVQGATIVGGGLFATTLRGDGWVALVSDGEPVVLRTDDAPVLVDTQALVAWTTGLATSVATSVKLPALVGLGSGEAVQLRFNGEGLVVVQPSEGRSSGT